MEDCSLDWNDYSDHLKDLMIKMISTTEYTDLTLVCDDTDYQFKTHKSILSACSSELDKIIRKSPEKNPVIYLRGIHFKEMEALIQFMYLGRTTVNQQDLPDLLKVAQDLKIKGIGDKEIGSRETVRKTVIDDDEIMIMDKSSREKKMTESDAAENSLKPKKVTGEPQEIKNTLEENVLFDNANVNKSEDFKQTIKNAMTKVNEDHDSSFEFSFEQAFPNDEKTASAKKTQDSSDNVVFEEGNPLPVKRGRGRPRKSDIVIKDIKSISENFPVKRGRGRPKKVENIIKEEFKQDVIIKDPLAQDLSPFPASNITVIQNSFN